MAPSPADLVAYSIRIVSSLVLILGVGSLALGLWTIYTGDPIVDFLNGDANIETEMADIDTIGYKTRNDNNVGESKITIRVLGGLLITTGCVLIINFILGMFASFRLMAVCCIPSVFSIQLTLFFYSIFINFLLVSGIYYDLLHCFHSLWHCSHYNFRTIS